MKNNQTKKRGQLGEKLAKQFLQDKGYFIHETNWRWGKLEIDLIGTHKDILHFIEVKTRYSDRFGKPEDFVNTSKMDRLFRAASQYMYLQSYQEQFCFDIISIVLFPEQKILFFEDAFFPGWL